MRVIIQSIMGLTEEIKYTTYEALKNKIADFPYVYMVEENIVGKLCGYNDKGEVVARIEVIKEEED